MLQTRTILLFAAVLSLTVLCQAPACGEESHPPKDRPNYLIVTANDFAAAAKEWGEYRTSKDRKVKVVTLAEIGEMPTVNEIKDFIAKTVGPTISDALQVLLIGDAPKDSAKYDPKVELPWFVTTYKDEQGSLIAGDNYYADLLKDDEIPEIAVGRIPARTVEEVQLALKKVQAYEAAKYGEWVKRLTFFAGEGHYGPLIDGMIEAAFTQFVDEHVDNAYDLRMTYANLDSPYAWIPSKFSEKVIDEANMGSLLLTYIGHGSWDHLDQFHVKVGGKLTTYPILKADDVSKFAIKDGQLPVMLIIACDTGWLDAMPEKRCLAERILFADNAPVAVIASSRNSHPYSNMIVQKGIVQGMANKKLATLGDTFAYMKRELMLAEEPDRADLEAMAAMLMPKKKERNAKNQAHLYLYNLIGDPGLKLKHPDARPGVEGTATLAQGSAAEFIVVIKPEIPARPAAAGSDSSVALKAVIEARRRNLVAPPAKFDAADLFSEDQDKRAKAESIVTDNHAAANNKQIDAGAWSGVNYSAAGCSGGTFKITAKDTLAPGDYLVKIFALDAKGEHCGFAAIPLKVEKKKE